MKKIFVIPILAFMMIFLNANTSPKEIKGTKSKIQVALLLDTSNSMDGLIQQAKTELWSVVNKLATAKYEGEVPQLEIALYEYGNDGLPSKEGYVRQVSQFTTDLDKISEALFSLKTNGGSEYCGYVIDKATIQLDWSKSDDDLKMIFIAGNEEFTQGPKKYDESCKDAIKKGIVINTIFCGNQQQGVNYKWKDGALLADGKYLNIDQNQTIVHIDSPFDDEILRLSSELNKTYIAFGAKGKKMKNRQEMQDKNNVSLNKSAGVNRSVSKSSVAYKQSSWDLVDASEEADFEIESVKEEALPEEMKGMNEKERKEYIDKKKAERIAIQEKIKELNEKREKYVSDKMKENAQESTLGNAMMKTVNEQAVKKNYSFEK